MRTTFLVTTGYTTDLDRNIAESKSQILRVDLIFDDA